MRRSLTREERLRSGREIRGLFSAARSVEGRGVRLLYRRNDGQGNRVAVVVARGCGGAVRRNREKRITREAYRSLKETITPGHDLVFLVLRFRASLAQRRAALRHVIDRAGLQNAAPLT
jgi:ribonuclease P protein component